ncbi:hypothetical protein J3R03_003134 [Actinoplanes couchii]|nr:hypothetical protein [Actinoplanes couchii]
MLAQASTSSASQTLPWFKHAIGAGKPARLTS